MESGSIMEAPRKYGLTLDFFDDSIQAKIVICAIKTLRNTDHFLYSNCANRKRTAANKTNKVV